VIDQQRLIVTALAFLVDNLGYPAKGGRELRFSNEKLAAMSPTGTIQVEADATRTGWLVRYSHNRTIDTEAIKDDGVGGLLQHPEADDEAPA
jgi:hypothetical protein